jgi:hypothetical protein
MTWRWAEPVIDRANGGFQSARNFSVIEMMIGHLVGVPRQDFHDCAMDAKQNVRSSSVDAAGGDSTVPIAAALTTLP